MKVEKNLESKIAKLEDAANSGKTTDIIGDHTRLEWLNCLKTRRLVLLEDPAISEIEPLLDGKRVDDFCFKKLPFEKFTFLINSEKYNYFYVSIFPLNNGGDDKICIVGLFISGEPAFFPILADFESKIFRVFRAEDQKFINFLKPEFMLLNYCLNRIVESVEIDDAANSAKRQTVTANQKWKISFVVSGWTPSTHGKKTKAANTGRKLSLHFRRGHYRRIKSGRMVWVKETTAGSILSGMVCKMHSIHMGAKKEH